MSVRSAKLENALFARADRAIADAIAIRVEVRAKLEAAERRPVFRAGVGDVLPQEPLMLPMSAPLSFLEPWWSVARALADADEIIREADRELESGWHRILPTIETPLSVFRG